MTPATAKQYGAYHRVSQLNGRDPDAENYMTEDVAWEQIDGWAKMRGVEIADRYLDRDQTGSKMNRTGLDRMISDLRAGVIDGIAVAQVDRLSRADVGDALAVVKDILDIAPGQLALLDLGIDPATEFGEFGLTILLALSRMQWRRYKRTWATAQARAVKRGVWVGPAPFGYRFTVIGRHPKSGKPIHGPLEEDPTDGLIVREVFRIAAADGMHAAMAYLKQAVPDRRWRTDEARRLLSRRAYLGEITIGEGNRSAHPPLTTLARFEAAQTEPQQRRSNGDYPLSGIARCECGAPMVGALQSVQGRRYRRMRCSAPACRGGSSIAADKIETYVREVIGDMLSDKRIRDSFAPNGIEEARDALEVAESERKRFAADLDIRTLLGDDAWRDGARSRTRAVEEARDRYQLIAGQAARSELLPAAGQLDDPEQFQRALRAVVATGMTISVRSGRGAVEDRVTFHDADPESSAP